MTSERDTAFERVQDRYSWWYATATDVPAGQIKPKDLVSSSYEHAQTAFRALLPGWWWLRVLVMSHGAARLVPVVRAGSPDNKTRLVVPDSDDTAADIYALIDKATTETKQ